jgi:bacteriocin biosynthesis cyclodehydratase domain-containing protein
VINVFETGVSINPVHVLSVGPFGQAVVRHLDSLGTDLIHTDIACNLLPLPSAWPAARIVALVSWRPVSDLCELLNEFSHDSRIPFVPVVQDLTAIRVGPIIVPGSGPCWHCWTTRCRQHSGWTKERMSLSQHYSSHPQDGPRGYLEGFAAMAANRLTDAISVLDAKAATPGSVWQIDILTGEITTSRVIGVHDCRWCGLGKPKETRSAIELREALSYLWSPLGPTEAGS